MSVASIESFEAPWSDGRRPIHALVIDALAERGAAKRELRIEIRRHDPDEVSWAPGALDSLFGQPDESSRQTTARSLVAAINNVLRRPSNSSAAHLYKLLSESDTIATVDTLLPRLIDEIGDRRAALAALSRRLILESPVVEPVKAGVALLGVSGTADDAALVSTIGRYEEITLYSVVALRHLLADPDAAIWDLAKEVHGWGRIQAVERLAGTTNADIREWLLRDGFRNSIMYEYLACTCARSGGLREFLARDEIDPDGLIATGEIIEALVQGGPAESIEDYADGAAVCIAHLRHILRHLETNQARDVRPISAALAIKTLGEGDRAEQLRGRPGWTAQSFLDIRTLINAILQSPEAKAVVERSLECDGYTFNVAAHIAPSFGIDAWPLRLARQRSGEADQWFWLMRTEDPDRIEQVLGLARAQLDLALIGSGPTGSLGLGPDFRDDSALDFILQDLRRFPGKGWDLLKVGLRGRAVRARNMAINALRDWGQDAWPADAKDELRLAAARETEEDVRERFEKLIAGRLLEDD